MIRVTFYETSSGMLKKMKFEGHAEYAELGSDIVCSAVSMLFINTVNSIEKLTSCKFKMDEDNKSNRYTVTFADEYGDDVKILIDSLKLGLDTVVSEYGKEYLLITLKEV